MINVMFFTYRPTYICADFIPGGVLKKPLAHTGC